MDIFHIWKSSITQHSSDAHWESDGEVTQYSIIHFHRTKSTQCNPITQCHVDPTQTHVPFNCKRYETRFLDDCLLKHQLPERHVNSLDQWPPVRDNTSPRVRSYCSAAVVTSPWRHYRPPHRDDKYKNSIPSAYSFCYYSWHMYHHCDQHLDARGPSWIHAIHQPLRAPAGPARESLCVCYNIGSPWHSDEFHVYLNTLE
jgi:hypothetical protein